MGPRRARRCPRSLSSPSDVSRAPSAVAPAHALACQSLRATPTPPSLAMLDAFTPSLRLRSADWMRNSRLRFNKEGTKTFSTLQARSLLHVYTATLALPPTAPITPGFRPSPSLPLSLPLPPTLS
eukprot:6189453-Pleurochrysis_carterae.AAC.7